MFLSPRARERDDNLLFVRERIVRSERLAGLLDLYSKVRAGGKVPDDETNPLVSVLRLSGIVRAVGGQLRVRNRIYAHVFDKAWVVANMPDAELRRQRAAYRRGVLRAAGVAAVILVAMSVLAAVALGQRNRAVEEKNRADASFRQLQKTYEALGNALKEAKAQQEIADEQRRLAEEERQEADKQRQRAADEKQLAERESARAVAALKTAEAQRQIASQRAREAEEQRLAAERNRQTAEQNQVRAEGERARAEELSKLSIDTLFNITRFLESTNEKLRAVEYYEQLALIYRKAARKREEAETLLNIGDVYVKLKQAPKAAEYFERSLGVYRGAEAEEEGRTYVKIGNIYDISGDRARASSYYEQAVKHLQASLPALRTRTDQSARAGYALYYLSLAYEGLGDSRRALDYTRQALPLFRALNDSVMEAVLDIRVEELTQTVKDTP